MLLSCPMYQENFSQVFHFDNVEAVTIKLKPLWWQYKAHFETDFAKYCDARCIEYYLIDELGEGGNLHYHGIIGFPFDAARRKFQSWFNRYYGHVKKSTKFEAQGWCRYMEKGVPRRASRIVDYLFDNKFLVQPNPLEHGLKPL